jgi:hypothetical protein
MASESIRTHQDYLNSLTRQDRLAAAGLVGFIGLATVGFMAYENPKAFAEFFLNRNVQIGGAIAVFVLVAAAVAIYRASKGANNADNQRVQLTTNFSYS